MTRICIVGGPRSGKTTLAQRVAAEETPKYRGMQRGPLHMTDSLIEQCKHLGKDAWSEASRIASMWLDRPGPWIIEGVAVCRALRKWHAEHPDAAPPVDRIIRLTKPHVELSKGQVTMAAGEETVWREIKPWLMKHGVAIELTPSANRNALISGSDIVETFDPAQLAREKAASRAEDARAIASGEKTVEQLRAENSSFAFPRDRIRIDFPKKY